MLSSHLQGNHITQHKVIALVCWDFCRKSPNIYSQSSSISLNRGEREVGLHATLHILPFVYRALICVRDHLSRSHNDYKAAQKQQIYCTELTGLHSRTLHNIHLQPGFLHVFQSQISNYVKLISAIYIFIFINVLI